MNGTPNLSVFEGSVEDVLLDGDSIKGIVTADGTEIACKGVVITTGTFLRGKCYIGKVGWVSDRVELTSVLCGGLGLFFLLLLYFHFTCHHLLLRNLLVFYSNIWSGQQSPLPPKLLPRNTSHSIKTTVPSKGMVLGRAAPER